MDWKLKIDFNKLSLEDTHVRISLRAGSQNDERAMGDSRENEPAAGGRVEK